ncbi:MAG: hypothetical protein HZA14_00255, partial [Nitrospirae bacterium]|nr:hypothetical protein [Nitrospirota bacterium]
VVVAKVNGDYFRVTQTADPAGESDQVLLRFMCPDGIGYCQIDNVEDIEYSLVYKGKLGLEDGAVVFGDSVTRRYDSVTFDSHSWILNATVGGNKYLSGPIWEDIPKAYDIIRVRFAQDNPHLVGVLVRTTGDKYQAHLYATHDNALVYAGMKAEVAYHEIVPNAIAVSYAPFHFSGGGASVDSVLTATPTGEGYILRQATDLYVSKAGNATIVGGYFSGASVNISLDYRYSNSLPDLTITSHAVDNHFTTTTAFSSYPSDTMTGTIDTQSTASFILSTGFFRNDALSPIQSGNTNINLPIRDTNFNATLMPCAYRCVAGYCGGYTGQWMSFKSYGGRDTYSFYSPFYSFNTDPETFEYVCETSVAPDGNVNYATNPTPSCPAQEKKLADIMPSVTYEALY